MLKLSREKHIHFSGVNGDKKSARKAKRRKDIPKPSQVNIGWLIYFNL